MRKVLLLACCLCLTACTNTVIQQGRDVAAAGQGAIVAAQARCSTNASDKACPFIPNAASAQNALVTALETACGWSPSNPPAADAKCTVNQSAIPALQTAIVNMNQFISELRGAGQ